MIRYRLQHDLTLLTPRLSWFVRRNIVNTQQEITAVNIRTITGSNIKRLREAHDYTQSQLASRLGTQPQNVSALETGALGLSDNKLAKLCKVLASDLKSSSGYVRLTPRWISSPNLSATRYTLWINRRRPDSTPPHATYWRRKDEPAPNTK